MFPQAIGNAATWDAPLVEQIGDVVSTEARAKYNDALRHNNHDRYYGLTIWSPNINIFRDPRWGRGQETYGEDPFLTARLGTAFVRASRATTRTTSAPSPRPSTTPCTAAPSPPATRPTSIPPRTTSGTPTCPPSAPPSPKATPTPSCAPTTRIDNVPACASKMLLGDILRSDWRFHGFVTSDCDAIDDFSQPHGHHYSADHRSRLRRRHPRRHRPDCGNAYNALADAVHKSLITEAQLDVSLKRLFTARMRLGMFDPPQQGALLLDPLQRSQLAANTPNSPSAPRANPWSCSRTKTKSCPSSPKQREPSPSSARSPPRASPSKATTTPSRSIPSFPSTASKQNSAPTTSSTPKARPTSMGGEVPVPRTMLRTAAELHRCEGLKAEYFATPDFDGAPEITRTDKEIDFDWAFANPVPSLSTDTTNQTSPCAGPAPSPYPSPATYNFQSACPSATPATAK